MPLNSKGQVVFMLCLNLQGQPAISIVLTAIILRKRNSIRKEMNTGCLKNCSRTS